MPVRKITLSTANNSDSISGGNTNVKQVSVGTNTEVKRVTVGRPVRRVKANAGNLSDLNDMFASVPQDGDVLVYHEDDGKWHAQKLLEKQIINGGQY